MSTPSSIVGEQYSSGRSPAAEVVLAVEPVLLRAPARCAHAPASRRSRGQVAVQVAEERVDPGGLLAAERLAQRVAGAVLPVAGMPPQRPGVDAVLRPVEASVR